MSFRKLVNIAGQKQNSAYSIFETLENRCLFSVTLPTSLSATPLHHSASHSVAFSRHPRPRVHAVPVTNGTGLTGVYFQDANFQTGYLLRRDPSIKLAPNAKKDIATTVANSVRWTGKVAAAFSEAYSFSVVATGGVRLWVNGQLLIDQLSSGGGNFRSTTPLNLLGGQQYDIRLDYSRKSPAGTSVKLFWSSLHQKQGIVPQTSLFPDSAAALPPVSSGLIGQYFTGKDFSSPAMQRVDSTIDFNWGRTSPGLPIAAASPFSIRWTGQIQAAYSEAYTFSTVTDDGVRLWVDDQLLIDNFSDHSATTDKATISLQAGRKYDIRMDYYENHFVATAQLFWSSPSQPLQIVPASAFTSTPPATAGILSALVNSADTITLNWTGSPAAAGYLVQQSTDGGATFSTIATTAANVLQYPITGLSPASNYSFKVIPVGSIDTSIASNIVQATTATLSPGALLATPVSNSVINVNWANVTGQNGTAIFIAPLLAGSSSLELGSAISDGFSQVGTVAAGVNNFSVTGLNPGTAYQFVVKSVNSTGVGSSPSAIATATTYSVSPSALTHTIPLTNAITLNWADVAGETGFIVERSLNGIDGWAPLSTTAAGVTTYTDTTVQPGVGYFYRVTSSNAGGLSDPSAVIGAVTAVNSPASLTAASTTATGTVLHWSDVAMEAGFIVLESTDSGATFTPIGTTPAGVTAFSVTGLTSASNYLFEVEAVNAAAVASAASNAVPAITLTAAPASLLSSLPTINNATLTWTDVTGETGFIIEKSSTGTSGWTTAATVPAGTLSTIITSLYSGSTTYFRVRALSAGGTSDASPVASALTIPAAPVAALTGLSVSQSQVSWPAVTGATQYLVERSANGVTNWTTATTASGSALSAAVSNIAPSTVYYYRVTAINASGQSSVSNVVNQMTAPIAQYATDSNIYGMTSGSTVFSLNMLAGTSTSIGQMLSGAYCANRCPIDGQIYYFVGSNNTPRAYAWDPTTGNNTFIAQDQFTGTPNRAAWDAAGNAWITDTAGKLYKVPATTHSLTQIATLTMAGTPITSGSGNMCFSPGGTLYLLNNGMLYTVNQTTGALTSSGVLGFNATNLIFGNAGLLYCTTPTGQQYSLNPSSLVSSLLSTAAVPTFTSLTATPKFDDLSVTSFASSTAFTAGIPASYQINVSNSGQNGADGISVTVTLGLGLSYSSIAGANWTAIAGANNGTGQTVVLTYTGTVAAGGNASTATLNFIVGSSAHVSATTSFAVAGNQFDNGLLNNNTTVTTTVI